MVSLRLLDFWGPTWGADIRTSWKRTCLMGRSLFDVMNVNMWVGLYFDEHYDIFPRRHIFAPKWTDTEQRSMGTGIEWNVQIVTKKFPSNRIFSFSPICSLGDFIFSQLNRYCKVLLLWILSRRKLGDHYGTLGHPVTWHLRATIKIPYNPRYLHDERALKGKLKSLFGKDVLE